MPKLKDTEKWNVGEYIGAFHEKDNDTVIIDISEDNNNTFIL